MLIPYTWMRGVWRRITARLTRNYIVNIDLQGISLNDHELGIDLGFGRD